ncbi:MAG: PQQ-binding-like beta-propeller repeat protein, partial [bacterium]|nr:PQQ-binding-like beta-propeller repeat protein [bacterium]
SSISIADGRAITMFSDSTFDFIASYDAESGEKQWSYQIDSTYIGHTGSHNGPLSTPIIEGNRVYALGPNGQLFALDVTTGKAIWSKHIITDHQAKIPEYGFTTAPIIDGDVLIVETGGTGSTISGLDKNTGKLLWATGNDTVQYQSPIQFNVHGENHLVCIGDNYVNGMDVKTGKKLWGYRHQGRRNSINPVVAGENRLFLTHNFRRGMLLEIDKTETGYEAKELWTTTHIKQTHNASVFHEGYLYGYSNRFVSCVDAKTGKNMWKSRTPGAG